MRISWPLSLRFSLNFPLLVFFVKKKWVGMRAFTILVEKNMDISLPFFMEFEELFVKYAHKHGGFFFFVPRIQRGKR